MRKLGMKLYSHITSEQKHNINKACGIFNPFLPDLILPQRGMHRPPRTTTANQVNYSFIFYICGDHIPQQYY